MSKKKTKEEFLTQISALYPNNDYTFLEEYIDGRTKLKVRHNCTKCNNYEFMSAPSDFLQGYGCPKCAGRMRKTQKEFEQEVFEAVGNEYTVLGTYRNGKTKLLMRHNCEKCNNHEWEVVPKNFLLNGTRCPVCAGNQKITNKDFKKRIYGLVKDEFTVIGAYKNNHAKLLMRHNCDKCNNNTYEVTPDCFLKGSRCPKCNESKGERKIFETLDDLRLEFKREFIISECKYEQPLRFDFAIFSKNNNLIGLIEFDGSQHFKLGSFGCKDELKVQERFELTQLRDSIKTKYCEDNNIPLLRIKYIQFDEIETIVNDFLKNPTNYINNHSYGLTNEEYYEELKAS